MIRRQEQVEAQAFEQCHEGVGTLLCRSMLMDGDSQYGVMFFHHDHIPAGVSIGEHLHQGSEEIYYLLSGNCTLWYDGRSIPMKSGDFSIVQDGHTHGIVNSGDCTAELIVVGIKARS